MVYGPYTDCGGKLSNATILFILTAQYTTRNSLSTVVIRFIAVAATYGFQKQPMKGL